MHESFEKMVTALAKPGQEIIDEMNASTAHLLHMAVGVSGEAGELLDAIKKHAIYNKPVDVNNIIEELGDIEFYMEGLRQELSITRENIIENNVSKLSKRYGASYSDQAAQQRADKTHTGETNVTT